MQKGVTFTPDMAVLEIRGTEVQAVNVYSNEMQVFSDFDTVVVAMGNEVDDSLYHALKGRVKDSFVPAIVSRPEKWIWQFTKGTWREGRYD